MKIHCADGRCLDVDLTPSKRPRQGTIIISGATGVQRSFYEPFAHYLSAQGFDVMTFDFRGVGKSRIGSSKSDNSRMRDWGLLDLEAVLQRAAEHQGNWSDLALIGHSSGAHLSPLAPSFHKLQKAVFIASGTCEWTLYPIKERPKLLFAWCFLWPSLLHAYGYLPKWAGVGAELPAGVVRELSRWSLSKGYLFSDKTLDSSGYAKWAGELHAISFTDDLGFSPPATVQNLLGRFNSATLKHHSIEPSPETGEISHFGFFKHKHKDLWPHALLSLNLSGLDEQSQEK